MLQCSRMKQMHVAKITNMWIRIVMCRLIHTQDCIQYIAGYMKPINHPPGHYVIFPIGNHAFYIGDDIIESRNFLCIVNYINESS